MFVTGKTPFYGTYLTHIKELKQSSSDFYKEIDDLLEYNLDSCQGIDGGVKRLAKFLDYHYAVCKKICFSYAKQYHEKLGTPWAMKQYKISELGTECSAVCSRTKIKEIFALGKYIQAQQNKYPTASYKF
ncbi:hypothetical protein N9O57_00980 [bacterium]|nr:hypothetical protein [bacterium]